MTSDAKVGLLLGLVFIFVIALLVNGLPSFQKDKGGNELTTNGMRLNHNTPAMAASERRVSREIFEPAVRYKMPLEQVERSVQSFGPGAAGGDSSPTSDSVVIQTAPKLEAIKVERIEPVKPKIYLVAEGDSLASIAKKFYGDVEGNRKINIDKIFAANKGVLESADEIYVGQKLVIPVISALAARDVSSVILDNALLEKVDSIGRRHLQGGSTSQVNAAEYVIVEGDSLWKIAAEKLGDGSRYTEIVRFNSDVIKNEDYLEVGTKLKLPPK